MEALKLVRLWLCLMAGVEGLRCYQCKWSGGEGDEVCTDEFFHRANKSLRREAIHACPTLRSTFCLKHIAADSTVARGCLGPEDSLGNPLAVGCVALDKHEYFCLCDEDLCNQSSLLDPPRRWTLLLLPFLYAIFNPT